MTSTRSYAPPAVRIPTTLLLALSSACLAQAGCGRKSEPSPAPLAAASASASPAESAPAPSASLSEKGQPPAPPEGLPPPPELAGALGGYAVSDASFARKVLYTWTTKSQVDEMKKTKVLLSRSRWNSAALCAEKTVTSPLWSRTRSRKRC